MIIPGFPVAPIFAQATSSPTGSLGVGNVKGAFFGHYAGAVGSFSGSIAGFDEEDVFTFVYSVSDDATVLYITGGPTSDISVAVDGISETLLFTEESAGDVVYSISGDVFDLQNKVGQTLDVFGEFV